MQTLFRREIICARSAQIQVQWYPPVAPNGATESSQQKSIVQRARCRQAA